MVACICSLKLTLQSQFLSSGSAYAQHDSIVAEQSSDHIVSGGVHTWGAGGVHTWRAGVAVCVGSCGDVMHIT